MAEQLGLSEIKVLLKSLIVSSPRGMTLEQLNRDYRSTEGQDIPYRKMGFSSLESFCKSINDALIVLGSGPQAKVITIGTEKSKHIETMNINSKKSKRGASSRSIYPGSYFAPSPPSLKPIMLSTQPTAPLKSVSFTNQNSSSTSTFREPSTTSVTSASSSTVISSSKITSTPVTAAAPTKNYTKQVLPDLATTKIPTPPTTSHNNIQSTSTQPRPLSQYYTNAIPTPAYYSGPPLYSQNLPYSHHNWSQMYGNPQYYSSVQWMQMYNQYYQYYYDLYPHLMNVQTSFNQYPNSNNAQMPGNVNRNRNPFQSSSSGPQPRQQSSAVTERNHENNAKNETRTEVGQTSDNLRTKFLKNKDMSRIDSKHSTSLPLEDTKKSVDNGSAAAVDSVAVKYKKISRNNPFLDDYDNINVDSVSINTKIQPSTEQNFDSQSINTEDVEFQKLLDKISGVKLTSSQDAMSLSPNPQSPETISSNNVYTSSTSTASSCGAKPKENKIKINIKTTKEKLENMSAGKKVSRKVKTHNDKLSALELEKNEINPSYTNTIQKETDEFEKCDAIPDIINISFIKWLDFPEDTATSDDRILPCQIPADIKDVPYFPLFIAEVNNPYKFWFHLLKDGENELDILMESLENVYNDLDPNKLQMRYPSIKPGQICAALYSNTRLWHRAEILENPTDDKVKILFVDYGTVSYVSLQNIKYLMKEFCKLPRQALRGSLSNIKPADHRWTRNATYCFLDMVAEVMLYAKSTEINYKDNVVHMIIIDTNGEKEFNINEALILKGHAKYCPDESKSVCVKRKKHFQERYPSHEMLEKGEYPSFTEIGKFLAKGFDFEEMQDENIVPVDSDEDILDYTKKLLRCWPDPTENNSDEQLTVEQSFEPSIQTKLDNSTEDHTVKFIKTFTKQNSTGIDNDLSSSKATLNSCPEPEKSVQIPISKKEKSCQTAPDTGAISVSQQGQQFYYSDINPFYSPSTIMTQNLPYINSVPTFGPVVRPPPGFEHLSNLNFRQNFGGNTNYNFL